MTEALLFGMAAGVALATLGAGFRQGLRDRAMRRRFGNHSLLALQKASQELGLPLPHLKQLDVYACLGKIEGMTVELQATVWGRLQVAVACKPIGIPTNVTLGPVPEQRVFDAGWAVQTSVEAFDRNFAVLLNTHERVRPELSVELLTFVASRFDPLHQMMVWDSGVLLRVPPPKDPNWIVAQMHLMRLWRSAERSIKEGVERGLIHPAADDAV